MQQYSDSQLIGFGKLCFKADGLHQIRGVVREASGGKRLV